MDWNHVVTLLLAAEKAEARGPRFNHLRDEALDELAKHWDEAHTATSEGGEADAA